MTSTRASPLEIALWHLLLLAYPVSSFLWRRDYPFWTAESFTLLGGALLAGLALTALSAGQRWQLRVALASLAILIVFLVQFDPGIMGLALCSVACFAAGFWLRDGFFRYTFPLLPALLLGAFLDSSRTGDAVGDDAGPVPLDGRLPPVLHVVLDGFQGLDGLPESTGSPGIKAKLGQFFEINDLTVFPRAYSRFAATGDSLAAMMNFQSHAGVRSGLDASDIRRHVIASNRYFDELSGMGYRFSLFQTEFLDFCQAAKAAVDRCWRYAQPNVRSVREAEGAVLRSRMLAGVLFRQSAVLDRLMDSMGWLADTHVAMHDPEVFDRVRGELLQHPAGRVVFAHALLPHDPYAFGSDCSVSYASEPWARIKGLKQEPVYPDKVYEARRRLYAEQAECALESLQQVFDDMRATGIYDSAAIVIHGDHGSRIARHAPFRSNLDRLTGPDYRAHFSTLFAAKLPRGRYAYHETALSLDVLLKSFLDGLGNGDGRNGEFAVTGPPSTHDPYIFLTGDFSIQKVEIDIFAD